MNSTNATNTTPNITSTPNVATSESLVAEARRRGFNITGGFMPRDLIPMVEAAITQHNTRERGYTESSCDYLEWKQHMDNLHDFLALLKTLPPCFAHGAPDPKLKKQHADPARSVRPIPSQQHPPVCVPSDQASDTRPDPVRDPSAHAPDASDTSPANPPKSTAAESLESQPEYILLHENPSRSPIDDFPPERQLLLYTLLLETNCVHVARLIARPEPLGWNFKTSDTSLKRFKKRYRKKLERAEHMAAFREARTFLAETAHDEQSYMDATRRLLKIRLYKNAADPEGSDDKIELILRLLDRQRRTYLAERRVRIAEQHATKK